MKILLLKPINNVYYVIQPNLGLGYLATIMLKKGHKVHILDSGKERLGWNDFISRIKKEEYDLVGIQMFTYEIPSVKKHTEIIKRYSPQSVVILGGAHISGDPEGTLNLVNADFGFVGEAEIGIEEFLQLSKADYTNPDLLKRIPNLVWRQNAKVIINMRQSIQDLDKIGFPAWHLMPPGNYPVALHGVFCKREPVAPLIISRGCPFECTFCAGKSITGRLMRYRTVENVIKEIILLYQAYGVREFHIQDDNFTAKRDYVLNFSQAIIKLNLGISFALSDGVRLDTLDEEMLKLMEKAGFYSMAVGIESGSNRILKLIKKNLSKEIIREKISLIKKHIQIDLTGFFMLGYPTETESEILETITFAKSLDIDRASFLFVKPFPGSLLWDVYKGKNRTEIDWQGFFFFHNVKGLSSVPDGKLKKLQKMAFLKFYLRGRILWGLIKCIKSFYQLKIIIFRLNDIFSLVKSSRQSLL